MLWYGYMNRQIIQMEQSTKSRSRPKLPWKIYDKDDTSNQGVYKFSRTATNWVAQNERTVLTDKSEGQKFNIKVVGKATLPLGAPRKGLFQASLMAPDSLSYSSAFRCPSSPVSSHCLPFMRVCVHLNSLFIRHQSYWLKAQPNDLL